MGVFFTIGDKFVDSHSLLYRFSEFLALWQAFIKLVKKYVLRLINDLTSLRRSDVLELSYGNVATHGPTRSIVSSDAASIEVQSYRARRK